MKPDYDTTLARIAGTIAAGLVSGRGPMTEATRSIVAREAVQLAERIVEVCRRRPVEALQADIGIARPGTPPSPNQCCARDTDGDGNCDQHPAGVPRG